MITVFMAGQYKLIETKNDVKILYLDDVAYVWISVGKDWNILEATNRDHRANRVLSAGNYALYDVDDEPYLVDLQHLELAYSDQAWQGYLLPTGLPDDKKKRVRIIPTTELISDVSYFSDKLRHFSPTTVMSRYGKTNVGRNYRHESASIQ